MAISLRSKKMVFSAPLPANAGLLDFRGGKWSGFPMTNGGLWLNRRGLLAGLGGVMFGPCPALAAPAGRPALALQARPGVAALRHGLADTPVWSLLGPTPDTVSRFRRGDELEVTLENQLPIPIALIWRGIDGASGAAPLSQLPFNTGGEARSVIP